MLGNSTIPFAGVAESVPAVSFLRSAYPPHLFQPALTDSDQSHPEVSEKPFVTLTYAQSLDAKIAGKAGKQLILSGKQSMELTHRMRELHDSILVGIGTMLNDDPQLNARIPSLLPVSQQPRPIILDRSLRTPKDCKLLRNFQAGIGKAPVIVTQLEADDEESAERRRHLTDAGAVVARAPFDRSGHVSLSDLVTVPTIRSHLGRSLMVEGGSSVISSFLSSPDVDLVVATVAPVYVGEGVELVHPGTKVPELEHVKTQIFGNDTVFASRPVRR